MHAIDIAENLHFELDEPANVTIPKILKWLLFHIGDLNDFLGSSYTVSGNDFSPELSDDVGVILAAMFMDDYYTKQIRNYSNAGQFDVLEVREGDSTVRVANRNEIAKTLLQLKTQNREYLNKLIKAWRVNQCVPASLHNSFYCGIIRTQTP